MNGLRAERLDRALRWPVAASIAGVAAASFLITVVPPLTDVPGHIGRFAVQTASADDPVMRYFGFHWALTLNLASDVLVQLLHPALGIVAATRMLCALTPGLTAMGIFAIARRFNARGAAALPWALIFVFNFPFLWGFLNFSLTAGLALLAFPAWFALAPVPRRRAAAFLAIIPILIVGHGVAGMIGIGLIVGYSLGDALGSRSAPVLRAVRAVVVPLWPVLIATLATLVAWKMFGVADRGRTVWLSYRKTEAILDMLKDQNAILDVGSVIAAGVIWTGGWRSGARLGAGARGAVAFLVVVFVASPSLIGGSDRIDTRLAPLIPMVAFALQDWSAVTPSRRSVARIAGFTLLAVRFAVTVVSFAGYEARYRQELSALGHVPRGAKILNLSEVSCTDWRSDRLEHLANLATPLRGAWTNAHWSIPGLQLLQVRFRPSGDYARDPSHLIWPSACFDLHTPFAGRDRHALVETVLRLPLDRVDYLWLIDAKLPPAFRDPRLERVWADDISELYAIGHAIPQLREMPRRQVP